MAVPCGRLIDNGFLHWQLGAVPVALGEMLALRIRTKSAETGAAPTVWLTNDERRIPGHVVCYVGGSSQIGFGLHAALTYNDSLATTDIPKIIQYSPVSQCNLNCIHCISRSTRTTANHLPSSIKARIKDWCLDKRVDILLTDYSGDILWADWRFGGELDFIFALGIPFHIDTNGAYLIPSTSKRLCQSHLHSINISLDAATELTLQRVRKGAPPLQELRDNIAGLIHERSTSGALFKVSISFTLMQSTLSELPEFLELGATLGVDTVVTRHLEAYTADMEPDSLWHDQAGYNSARAAALDLAERLGVCLEIPPPFNQGFHTGRTPCPVPWTSAMILANGDVAACCVPGTVMGNLNRNSMEEIWSGPSYRNLRATVNSRNPAAPCSVCPVFKKTDNRDSYLFHSALRRAAQNKCDG